MVECCRNLRAKRTTIINGLCYSRISSVENCVTIVTSRQQLGARGATMTMLALQTSEPALCMRLAFA
jgi:hypothetical protein